MPTDNTRTGKQPTNTEADMKPKKKMTIGRAVRITGGIGLTAAFMAVAGGVIAVAIEAQTSIGAKHLGGGVAKNRTGLGFSSKKVTTPQQFNSPLDKVHGEASIEKDDKILREQHYDITADPEHWEHKILGHELYSLADPKPQSGMTIKDASGEVIYASKYPRQAFKDFNDIPELWWKSLLAMENRDLIHMDKDKHAIIPSDDKDVTIEWPRMVKASGLRVLHNLGKYVGIHVESPGASGLATQIEKLLHSPNGQTADGNEKAKQILTAMAKYQKDHDAQKIVTAYFNLVPLSSTALDGNVEGMAEGMLTWFGRDIEYVKKVLNTPDNKLDAAGLKEKAQIYRETLALSGSVKMPSAYYIGNNKKGEHLDKAARLAQGHAALEARIDQAELPRMLKDEIITPEFAALVRAERLQFADPNVRHQPETPSTYKYVNNLRIQAQNTMKIPSMYDLERRDITFQATTSAELSRATEELLAKIKDPVFARANGLIGGPEGKFLFDERDLPFIQGAVIINERLPDGRNVSRVLTDNVSDSLLNLTSGGRLGEGSTSKLRWGLTQYEMNVGELFDNYAGKTPDELRARLKEVNPSDGMTQWALTYLLDPATDKTSFQNMLDASLERLVSGNLGDTKVQNFESKENGWNVSIRKNFHHSVNAAFVRIERMNVNYALYEKLGAHSDLFKDLDNPQRQVFLNDFTRQEGAIFLGRAFNKQNDKTPEQIEKMLIDGTKHKSPSEMAALFRYLHPEQSAGDMIDFIVANADPKQVEGFLNKNLGKKTRVQLNDLYARHAKDAHPALKDFITANSSTNPILADEACEDIALTLTKTMVSLYTSYAPGAYDAPARERVNKKTGEVKKYAAVYDLNERAYKLHVHPLDLWLAKYRMSHPTATFKEAHIAAQQPDAKNGMDVYRQSYDWLFKASKVAAQNRSIYKSVRHSAFKVLLEQQRKFGYPFETVVDDERIVLGSNGDTPQALATLLSIIQNDGILKKTETFSNVNRFEGTDHPRSGVKHPDEGVRVMRPEIARSLRQELQGVVEEGTGKRMNGAFKVPNPDGPGMIYVPSGGKTGSDDGKLKGKGGAVIGSKGRTATWTFTISDRFYGTVLLYVDGKPAADPASKDPSKLVNPALRAHFTSATAVIFTKLLFERPEFQAFLTKEFAGTKIAGATPVIEKKLPVPQKPKAPAQVAANGNIPALAPKAPRTAPN